MDRLSDLLLPAAVGAVVLRGVWRRVDVYDAFLDGAGRGFRAAVPLLPALCGMLLMLRLMEASGLMTLLTRVMTPLTSLLRLPKETAPLLLLRPLTGSGSLSALAQVLADCGPDSRTGRIACVLVGSSETIFYTMTVYLGACGAKRLPWVVPVSLASYLVGAAVAGAVL